ncbi:Scn11a [Symbiodinium sp. CCMP2456]|nr:Scn11a [Symbiodinium sp. CCMP2456]
MAVLDQKKEEREEGRQCFMSRECWCYRRRLERDYAGQDFNLDRAEWDFDEYWGSVLRSSYSLFQVVTRDKWSDSLVWPLVEENPGLMVVFICFLTVASLSLMNSVIGVVVESTLSSARATADREKKVKERIDKLVLQSMREIFEAADTDKSGRIDKDELQASFRNHRVKDRLKLLHIPFKDLEMLFGILDDENDGEINTDKFFRGVERLRGQAAASDLHQMNIDLNKRLKWCDSHQKEARAAGAVSGRSEQWVDILSFPRSESWVQTGGLLIQAASFVWIAVCICVCVCVSVCLFVCLFVCLSVCLSLPLAIYLFVYLSIYLSIYLPAYLSLCLSICLSFFYLYFFLPLSIHTHTCTCTYMSRAHLCFISYVYLRVL